MGIRVVAGIGIMMLAASTPAAQLRTAAQPALAVQSATPADLKLEKGGAVNVTLSGSSLGAVTAVQLMADERAAAGGVGAAIVPLPRVPTSPVTSITVRLTARWDAPEGTGFQLKLIAGTQALMVPASVLKVAVVWPRPGLSETPAEAEVGSVITLRGTGLGYTGQPQKTKVAISFGQTIAVNPVAGEVQSVSPAEIKVRVPEGAYYSRLAVFTPGGQAYSVRWFQPLYVRHFSPDIFQPAGALGVLHISESHFAFAHGEKNSAFNPSSAMLGIGAQQFLFTFPTRDQRIPLPVGATIFRVRLKGANRLSTSESLKTTAFAVSVSGTSVIVDLGFESFGTEFVGEYETQDVLTGRIHWKHCLDLEVDNLKVKVTLPIMTDEKPLNSPWQFFSFGGISAKATFTPRFSVIGTPPFTIGEGPIRDFIAAEAERQVAASLNSPGFKDMFNSYLTTYIRGYFQGTPVVKVKARTAADGGLDWVGRTNL